MQHQQSHGGILIFADTEAVRVHTVCTACLGLFETVFTRWKPDLLWWISVNISLLLFFKWATPDQQRQPQLLDGDADVVLAAELGWSDCV